MSDTDLNSPYRCEACGCKQGLCNAHWRDTGRSCCDDCHRCKARHWMLASPAPATTEVGEGER